MRKYSMLAFALALFVAPSVRGASGTVTHRLDSCDYFLVETASGFAVLEWYGGYDPDKDDEIVGAFTSYGMKTVYDKTSDEEIQVYVED